jgi:hypothetical protein
MILIGRSGRLDNGEETSMARKLLSGAAPGPGDTRLATAKASVVPTRHAASDCMVRLAGSRIEDRPVTRDRNSSVMHTVIHNHRIQATRRGPLASHRITKAELPVVSEPCELSVGKLCPRSR